VPIEILHLLCTPKKSRPIGGFSKKGLYFIST